MKDFKIEKDIIYNYFLGITGSGKSTSINYLLIEAPLDFERCRGGCYKIKQSNENYP